MATLSGDILRGHIDALVLATLEKGEAHGFEIMQRLNAEGRGAFAMKEGTLYPVLYRLERRRCLAARWDRDDAPRKGPRRRLYRLTAKGRKELAVRRETWQTFVSVVGDIVEA